MYYDNDPLLRREVDALVDDGFEVDILCMRRGGEQSWIETAPPLPSLDRYDRNLASSLRRFAPKA